MAVFGNKDKAGNFVINFKSVENGVPGIGPNAAISVTVEKNYIRIDKRVGKDNVPVYLEIDKIIDFGVRSEKEVIEIVKNKSSIKRAAVGGLLLGPLGAVIGAVDGTGSKSKKKNEYRNFFIINYVSESGDVAALTMEVVGATLGLGKFRKLLDESLPKRERPSSIAL